MVGLKEPWTFSEFNTWVTQRFLDRNTPLHVVARTPNPSPVGVLKDYWYLVIPQASSKNSTGVFGFSTSQEGPFYVSQPLWVYGAFLDLTAYPWRDF